MKINHSDIVCAFHNHYHYALTLFKLGIIIIYLIYSYSRIHGPSLYKLEYLLPTYRYASFVIHTYALIHPLVAFSIYDIDQDGFISNGELFQVLKTMVGNNLTDKQLQEIVDKTILYADKDGDGKISFQEFCDVSAKKSS